MKRLLAGLVAFALSAAGAHLMIAQQAPPAGGRGGGGQGRGAPQPMGFFVTSVGLGKGANLGGLAGADAIVRRWQQPPARAIEHGAPISAPPLRGLRRP